MRKHKLWIAAALWTPLIAQVPQLKLTEQPKPAAKPLGNTRFPAAKALEFQVEIQQPAAQPPAQTVGAPSGPKLPAPDANIKLTIVPPMEVCAHIRRVEPSPATDPHMITGPPKGFHGNMPVVQAMPACESSPR